MPSARSASAYESHQNTKFGPPNQSLVKASHPVPSTGFVMLMTAIPGSPLGIFNSLPPAVVAVALDHVWFLKSGSSWYDPSGCRRVVMAKSALPKAMGGPAGKRE
jgi:hypothetical protein